MKSYEATGRTVEDAVSAGLAANGLSIGDVSVEILEEGSKGLFGLFGSREAKVRLTLKGGEETMGTTHELFRDSLTGKSASRTQQPQAQAQAPRAETREEPQISQEKPLRQRKPRKPVAESAAPEAPAPEKPARTKRPPRPAAPAAPAELVEPAQQAEAGTPQGIAQKFLQDVTGLMGVPVAVHVKRDDEGNVLASMQGDTQGILIGRRGETLDALQYLTSLMVNHKREEYVRVNLDSEGYRQRREDALVRLANRMANRAKRTGRRVRMEPMNPYERRILHSALQSFPGIATHSEGEDPNRRVIISPVIDQVDGPNDEGEGEA
ncbi:MAG: protein jag [Eubacteriales bacterium]|nr:protein jag [Eubacteriales bacterium]